VAQWFATRQIRHIYSSPLKRGQETARAIADVTGAPVEVDEALRELNVGSLEGRADEAAWRIHDDVLRRWWQGDTQATFPDGEDFPSLHARISGLLDRIAARHPHEDVVAIGHGGIFCNVLPRLCTIHWDPAEPFTQGNTGVSIFRRTDVLTCEQWNGLQHLL
jgi:probable phosphoglycerate mutase